MEPRTGSDGLAGLDRAGLEALLDLLPGPKVLVEAGSGDVMFANAAAHRLAGGRFPTGAPEERNAMRGFYATDPLGRRMGDDELPSMRAARGAPVANMEVDWHTPQGRLSLLVQGSQLPDGTSILSFDNITELKQAERERAQTLALLDALFEGAPIGVAYFDTELRYRRVNDKLAEINGVPADDHLGRTLDELLPEMDARVTGEFRRVLETGEAAVDVEFVGRTPASGEERYFSTAIYPVIGPNGERQGVGAVVLDITERREADAARERAREEAEMAAARARFLAEASMILDESLDYEATLSTVSRLAVPWMADWCVIDMLESDGTLRRVTTAHVDPAKVGLAREWHERYPPNPDAPGGAPNVSRTGVSEIYPEVTDEMLTAGARDEEHLAMVRSLGMRSAMIVPMMARGRTLGVITFIAAETDRRYGDADLLLAEELARRAATSIDNARLYTERSYIARTLQQSLLPPHLPDIPGLELAARYRPVGEGNEVGGDFYDLFDLGDSTWAVVIGDVSGKGAEAAALTALVRYTVRAIASVDKTPSEVLRLVNDAMLRQRSDSRFSTVVYARVKLSDTGVHAQIASGGHPLPVLVRAGERTEYAGEPGTLLGVVQDPDFTDAPLDLAPGDSLILYTDGVPEAGAPERLLDHDDLLAAVERCDPSRAGTLAECLEATAVEAGGGNPHDDIAIVVLHVPA
jgi:PAS domain S-box-containing protein